MEELDKYYNLCEVNNRKKVISKLKRLENEGKIGFELDGDSLTVDDLDLDIIEISDLRKFFEKNDVFQNLERNDEYENFDDFNNYEDDGF